MNDNSGTVICPNCGAARPAGIQACSNCGFGAKRAGAQCPNCGEQNAKGARVCSRCGKSLNRSRSILLWALLFAIIGVPAGCMGGCFFVVGTNSPGIVNGTIGLGLLGVLIFVGLLVMLIRSARR